MLVPSGRLDEPPIWCCYGASVQVYMYAISDLCSVSIWEARRASHLLPLQDVCTCLYRLGGSSSLLSGAAMVRLSKFTCMLFLTSAACLSGRLDEPPICYLYSTSVHAGV